MAKAKQTKTTPSDIAAQIFAPICDDSSAQTAMEITKDLATRGIKAEHAKVIRWVTEQIKLGKMEHVKVLRKNSRGVLRPIDAYRVIEN